MIFGDGHGVCRCCNSDFNSKNWEADRDLIIFAVNHHAKMVEVLAETKKQIRHLHDQFSIPSSCATLETKSLISNILSEIETTLSLAADRGHDLEGVNDSVANYPAKANL